MHGEIVDFLVFEDNTSKVWPFHVPYSDITLNDVDDIARRLARIGYESAWGSDAIFAACENVLGAE